MAVSITHNTPADGTFSAGGQAAWDEAHAVSGLGDLAEANAASPPALGGTTPAAGNFTTLVGGTSVTIGDGSAATASLLLDLSGVNDPSILFGNGFIRANPSGAAAGSVGLSNVRVTAGSGTTFGWSSAATITGETPDTSMVRAGVANSIRHGGDANTTTTSRTEINKAVTAFSDNVAKAVLTFTIPNAAHSASFKIRIVGSMGAGGAIGANESTQSAEYNVDIARTAGVATVATISAVIGQPAAASVAGAANIATTAALSAVSGANGATQTFTVNATLAKSGGSADNHTAMVHCSLLNANASGVTVA